MNILKRQERKRGHACIHTMCSNSPHHCWRLLNKLDLRPEQREMGLFCRLCKIIGSDHLFISWNIVSSSNRKCLKFFFPSRDNWVCGLWWKSKSRENSNSFYFQGWEKWLIATKGLLHSGQPVLRTLPAHFMTLSQSSLEISTIIILISQVRKGWSKRNVLTTQSWVKREDRNWRNPEVYLSLLSTMSWWGETIITASTTVVTMDVQWNDRKDRRPICVENTNQAGCAAFAVTQDSSRVRAQQPKARTITPQLTLGPAVHHCAKQL